MKTYDVCVPITGFMWVTVEAENPEAAVEAALESEDLCIDNIEEWEPHRRITSGNLLHASLNEAYAKES